MPLKQLRLGAVGYKLGNAFNWGLHAVNLHRCQARAGNPCGANGPVNVFNTFDGLHLDTHLLLCVLCHA